MDDEASELEPGLYSIGTVASLSGLSPNTIRTWERRYRVVEPQRSPAGGRRYSDGDLERLLLLRQLTSLGVSIGSAARLDASQLQSRLNQVRRAQPGAIEEVRVTLLHPELAARLHETELPWTILQRADDWKTLATIGPSDILIASLDALGPEPEAALEEALERCQANDSLVLYHFASREVLRQLASAGARLLQEPLSLQDLQKRVAAQLRSQVALAGDEAAGQLRNPPPRYSPAKVAKMREVATKIGCECPNHLATILSSLLAFEEYSLSCASRSPADAALHGKLYEQTGRARVMVEELLTEVIALEELSV